MTYSQKYMKYKTKYLFGGSGDNIYYDDINKYVKVGNTIYKCSDNDNFDDMIFKKCDPFENDYDLYKCTDFITKDDKTKKDAIKCIDEIKTIKNVGNITLLRHDISAVNQRMKTFKQPIFRFILNGKENLQNFLKIFDAGIEINNYKLFIPHLKKNFDELLKSLLFLSAKVNEYCDENIIDEENKINKQKTDNETKQKKIEENKSKMEKYRKKNTVTKEELNSIQNIVDIDTISDDDEKIFEKINEIYKSYFDDINFNKFIIEYTNLFEHKLYPKSFKTILDGRIMIQTKPVIKKKQLNDFVNYQIKLKRRNFILDKYYKPIHELFTEDEREYFIEYQNYESLDKNFIKIKDKIARNNFITNIIKEFKNDGQYLLEVNKLMIYYFMIYKIQNSELSEDTKHDLSETITSIFIIEYDLKKFYFDIVNKTNPPTNLFSYYMNQIIDDGARKSIEEFRKNEELNEIAKIVKKKINDLNQNDQGEKEKKAYLEYTYKTLIEGHEKNYFEFTDLLSFMNDPTVKITTPLYDIITNDDKLKQIYNRADNIFNNVNKDGLIKRMEKYVDFEEIYHGKFKINLANEDIYLHIIYLLDQSTKLTISNLNIINNKDDSYSYNVNIQPIIIMSNKMVNDNGIIPSHDKNIIKISNNFYFCYYDKNIELLNKLKSELEKFITKHNFIENN